LPVQKRKTLTELIEGFDDASAGELRVGQPPGLLEQLGQVRATEEGHAQEPQARCGIIVHGVNRDDVGMLQARHYLRFVSFGARDLEGDSPMSQADLLGQKNPGEGPSAKLKLEQETTDKITDPRQLCDTIGLLLAVTVRILTLRGRIMPF
jgi:hypothetical protein